MYVPGICIQASVSSVSPCLKTAVYSYLQALYIYSFVDRSPVFSPFCLLQPELLKMIINIEFFSLRVVCIGRKLAN
jgi:hypothetical protein